MIQLWMLHHIKNRFYYYYPLFITTSRYPLPLILAFALKNFISTFMIVRKWTGWSETYCIIFTLSKKMHICLEYTYLRTIITRLQNVRTVLLLINWRNIRLTTIWSNICLQLFIRSGCWILFYLTARFSKLPVYESSKF